MNKKGRNIFFNLPKMVMSLLYIPFFLVQLFFYCDKTTISNNESNQRFTISSGSSGQGYHGNTSIQSNKVAGKKANFRLNKRFQPANWAFCDVASFSIEVNFTNLKSFSTYTNPTPSPLHLSTKTLRGPPAVA